MLSLAIKIGTLLVLGTLQDRDPSEHPERPQFCGICGAQLVSSGGQLICPNAGDSDHSGG